MSLFVLALVLQAGGGPQAQAAAPQVPTTPQEEYELRRVGFDDFAAADFHHGTVVEWTRAYRGKYKEPLEGAAFYTYVGHPELAESFDRQLTKKGRLIGGGLAAATVGLVLGGYGVYRTGSNKSALDYGWGACGLDSACMHAAQDKADQANADERSKGIPMMIGGFGLAAIGAALATWGAVIDPNPVDAPGARRLADEYNKRLRAELGLEPTAGGAAAVEEINARTVWVAPVVGAGGMGVTLGLGF